MKLKLLFLAALFTSLVQAQNIQFADSTFKSELLDQNPHIDANDDGEVSTQEALAVLNIELYLNNEVLDYSDFDHFENLEFLDLWTVTTGLDYTFNNPKLKKLIFIESWANSIDISNCPDLHYIDFRYHFDGLQQLDLSNNSLLDTVYLADNELSQLDLQGKRI